MLFPQFDFLLHDYKDLFIFLIRIVAVDFNFQLYLNHLDNGWNFFTLISLSAHEMSIHADFIVVQPVCGKYGGNVIKNYGKMGENIRNMMTE